MATWNADPSARPIAATYPPSAWSRFIDLLFPERTPEPGTEYDGPCVGDHGAEAGQ